jgi:FkbM family methyltransferase
MAEDRTARDVHAPRKLRSQVSHVEVVLVAGLAAAVTFALTRDHFLGLLREASQFSVPAQEELAPLAARYGAARHSRFAEEWIVRDYFNDRRNGVFLDVGANHYRDENNTYFLEKALEWSGVAVDALPEFGHDYVQHRPKTRFVAAFVSDTRDGTVTFFVPPGNKLVASADHSFTVRAKTPGEPRQLPTTTLDAILEQASITALDFVSMDIELAEPRALAGFTIDRYRPSLVCIEGHPEVRQGILDYFAAHEYVLVGKYLRMDSTNLYFQPRRQEITEPRSDD